MKIKQAVILAAGFGKRMRPVTDTIPKPLIKVAGKPIIDYTIDNITEAGINEIIIIVGYLGEQIVKHLSNYSGATIYFVKQEERRGTAQAIGLAEPYIDDDFLVINGDILFERNLLKNFVSAHRDGEVSILGEEVEDARPYGVLLLKDGKVADIIEKPANPPTNLINAGFYIFPREIFNAIRQTHLSARGELEIVESIKILIDKKITARPLIHKGVRIELTQPSDVDAAEKWVAKHL